MISEAQNLQICEVKSVKGYERKYVLSGTWSQKPNASPGWFWLCWPIRIGFAAGPSRCAVIAARFHGTVSDAASTSKEQMSSERYQASK